MRADLHVHSRYTGSRHYRRAGLLDAYAEPAEIYATARAAGMDLVTITDLNSIEGCLRLLEEKREPPDFIVGEEVEASLPDSPLRVHLNVWGITATQHGEIARLRTNVGELAAYIRQQRIACSFNHFVGVLPVSLPAAVTYWRVLMMFDALEVRNGHQGRHYNELVASIAVGEVARRPSVGFVGGSDAHTLRRVGTTWTEATAATPVEFLEAIRKGRTAAGGRVRRRSDLPLDLLSLTSSHYRWLWSSLRRGEAISSMGVGGILRALAVLPVQVIGAPLIGTIVYLLRVRAQVRSLQREIALLDLREFRERMSSFPRPQIDSP